MNRMTTALLALGAMFVVLLFIVAGNDKGSSTEVGLLQGTPVVATATDAQCDALYEAIYRVKGEKNHYQLIKVAESLDCPFYE